MKIISSLFKIGKLLDEERRYYSEQVKLLNKEKARDLFEKMQYNLAYQVRINVLLSIFGAMQLFQCNLRLLVKKTGLTLLGRCCILEYSNWRPNA